jgi:DNA-binding response OmpR family regulator
MLVVGRDISLLSSGANVLTQAGYAADLVLKIDQAVRRVLVSRYQLTIVSATFTRDEQIAIRARLKQARPGLSVLLLSPKHDSPDALLTAVADRLKQEKTFQFGTLIDGPHMIHGID